MVKPNTALKSISWMWAIMTVPRGVFLLLLLQCFTVRTSGFSPSSTSGPSFQSVQFSCGSTVCPSGTDCVKKNGTLQCADPCQEYTVLNDDWRSTNNTSTQNLHCDRNVDWQGWYRLFLGQTSANIPEKCVAENRCGTHAPLWITTPHPTQSGQIVNRTVCNSWSGSCCRFSSHTIHIKLCYGNYFVYKLEPPSNCYLAYCAEVNETIPGDPSTTPDPSTATPSASQVNIPSTTTPDNSSAVEGEVRLVNRGNQSCSGRVEVYHDGRWGTVCDKAWDLSDANVVCRQMDCGPPRSALLNATFGPGSGPIWLDDVGCSGNETSITECRHPGLGVHNCNHFEDASVVCEDSALHDHQLICSPGKLQMGLDLADLTSGLNPYSGNLASLNCSWARVQNNTVWYEVDAVEGACGNTLTTNRTHAIYSNSLFVYPVINGSFNLPVSIPFSCAYPLETDTSLNVAIRPFLPSSGGILGSGAGPSAVMSLFRNSAFTETFPAGGVNLPLGSPLYVGVSVTERELRFVVVLEECYASHSSDPHYYQRFSLIQNKCSTDARQVSVIESGMSLRARFSALLFLLEDDYRAIYLHCNISLCDRERFHCVPSCQRRKYRSVSSSVAMDRVTIGPIAWDKSTK
ncbi:pancreatic secretory granule membrane major glycoprotein GP2-like [Labrus bergylta]|uniref:pancreatic secretory granule membrane major glycoprotein GP2-like n=1 Tax=Labrus bergylta TaxID=56723 RepID=UPI0033143048